MSGAFGKPNCRQNGTKLESQYTLHDESSFVSQMMAETPRKILDAVDDSGANWNRRSSGVANHRPVCCK